MADPPQAETDADQGKSDNESTENMSAFSEITDPRVDRKETKKFISCYIFSDTPPVFQKIPLPLSSNGYLKVSEKKVFNLIEPFSNLTPIALLGILSA